jgi:hypothetical protein
MIRVVLVLSLCCTLCSCTYSIGIVHTEGTAADVIDETSTNHPKISPVITAGEPL